MNIEKEKRAIQYLQHFQPKDLFTDEKEKYYLCYSGGKDSDCVLTLAKLAGVEFEAVHNLTTVDAPETVRYVKAQADVIIDKPPETMWQLIVKKRMPPTRKVRYCCERLKERGGKHRVKITGVRWEESKSRVENQGLVTIISKPETVAKAAEETGADYQRTKKKGIILNTDNDENRRFVEICYRTSSTLVNPIIDWTEKEVWEFLHHYGIKSNPLYEVREENGTFCPTGCKRIGCIGCPLQTSSGMKAELIRYPKYRDNYLRAFDKMLKKRIEDGLSMSGWKSGREVMMWWVGDDPRQLSLFGEPEYLKGACL